MAKCLSCGRKLTSEKSIACGFGSECRNKSRKAGTMSKRGNSWRRKIARTIGFARGEFQLGNTTYRKVDGKWFDTFQMNNEDSFSEESLIKFLNYHKQIIMPNEVSDKIYVLLCEGKTVEEILDKMQEV